MKIAIIGSGNMGGAIARGLLSSGIANPADLACSAKTDRNLASLRQEFPGVVTTFDNKEAVEDADIIILAVKPWLMEEVMQEIGPVIPGKALLCSVAAGISCSDLQDMLRRSEAISVPVFRIVPNTAAAVGASITFICSDGADDDARAIVDGIFEAIGEVMEVPERLIPAYTAMASCGIAFVFRYIRAAMEAGIEMGIYPKDAARVAELTARGAAELLLASGAHPEAEIDRVTTPGGITIRGINTLDALGFNNAVIKAHKACL